MDWLMGKARGVGKGLMSASSPVSAPVSPECPTQTNNAALSGSPLNVNTSEHDSRTVGLPQESSITNGTDDHPTNSRFASPVSSRSPGSSPSAKRYVSSEANQNSPENSEPMFLMEKYISQQLPFSTSAKLMDFHELVEPFPSMEQNEWLAAHTIALFDNISTLFDAIQELCTCSQLLPLQGGSVPSSSFWNSQAESTLASSFDEDKCKKHKHLAYMTSNTLGLARQELDTALSSCNDIIQSSKIFPVRQGDPFPADLPAYVTLICKNLLVCIIHLYLSHFHHLEQLELIPHMNTLAKHFFAFTTRFSIIEEKHFEPLLGFHKILLDRT